MSSPPIIVWFRNDLRLADQPSLSAAVARGRPIIPVYVHDPRAGGRWSIGSASRWWLYHSLSAHADRIAAAGNQLILRTGETVSVLSRLAKETGAEAIHCTRAYEPWSADQEVQLKEALSRDGIEVRRYGGALLREPEALRTRSGEPYKVFTPFWRALLALGAPSEAIAAPTYLPPADLKIESDRLEDWRLRPTRPDWSRGLKLLWTPGEAGALAQLDAFVSGRIGAYAEARDYPALQSTSRLSPHLHFGEVSPRVCWQRAGAAAGERPQWERGVETFLRELAWREFSYHLLAQFPALPDQPFRPLFANYPWGGSDEHTRAWQQGRTGYPIVDAGMRELWTTGYMHNRVRMIAASFLVKHLRTPWQVGEAWFWDTLVDADLANNAAGWQWVTGSGADAAPYFRIFNPVSQGAKFDGAGDYVRRWVPELARLPASVIHAPWTAGRETLEAAGVRLGSDYPWPIVDHATARAEALTGYQSLNAVSR